MESDMSANWAARERDWVRWEREQAQRRGASGTSPGEVMPFQERIVDRIQILLDHNVDVASEARAIAEDFSHQKLPDHAWRALLAMLASAANDTSNDRSMSRLARLVVALSQSQEARNNTDEVVETDINSVPRRQIAPGEVIECKQGRFISDLPGFAEAMSIRSPVEIMNNPKFSTPELLRKAWTNYNAFLAHLCRARDERGATCDELNKGWMERIGLETIRNGLEQASGTDAAQDNACAEAKWLAILRTHILTNPNFRDAGPFQRRGDWDAYMMGGSLWKSYIKPRLRLVDRWEFWKHRLAEILDDASFDEETRTTAWVVSE